MRRRPDASELLAWSAHLLVVVLGETVLWIGGPVLDAGGHGWVVRALLVGRTSALGLGAVVIGAAVVSALADAAGASGLAAGLRRLTLPSLRLVTRRAVGAGLALSLTMGPVAAGAEEAAPPPPVALLVRLPDAVPRDVMRRLDDVAAAATAQPDGSEAELGPATPDHPAVTIPLAVATAPAVEAAPSDPVPPRAPPVLDSTVVVVPGDSFWRIAERIATQRAGRAATADEVHLVWVRLIDGNRHLLPAPRNPDLLLPGITLTVPPAT